MIITIRYYIILLFDLINTLQCLINKNRKFDGLNMTKIINITSLTLPSTFPVNLLNLPDQININTKSICYENTAA